MTSFLHFLVLDPKTSRGVSGHCQSSSQGPEDTPRTHAICHHLQSVFMNIFLSIHHKNSMKWILLSLHYEQEPQSTDSDPEN